MITVRGADIPIVICMGICAYTHLRVIISDRHANKWSLETLPHINLGVTYGKQKIKEVEER